MVALAVGSVYTSRPTHQPQEVYRGFTGRFWPRGARSGHCGGEVAVQRRLGTGGGEREANARHGFDDAGTSLGSSGAAWRTRRPPERAPSGWRCERRVSASPRRADSKRSAICRMGACRIKAFSGSCYALDLPYGKLIADDPGRSPSQCAP